MLPAVAIRAVINAVTVELAKARLLRQHIGAARGEEKNSRPYGVAVPWPDFKAIGPAMRGDDFALAHLDCGVRRKLIAAELTEQEWRHAVAREKSVQTT